MPARQMNGSPAGRAPLCHGRRKPATHGSLQLGNRHELGKDVGARAKPGHDTWAAGAGQMSILMRAGKMIVRQFHLRRTRIRALMQCPSHDVVIWNRAINSRLSHGRQNRGWSALAGYEGKVMISSGGLFAPNSYSYHFARLIASGVKSHQIMVATTALRRVAAAAAGHPASVRLYRYVPITRLITPMSGSAQLWEATFISRANPS
jgi:hypothetical protein